MRNYEICSWANKVIQSCVTMEQLKSARKLIRNFETNYSPNYAIRKYLWHSYFNMHHKLYE